MGWNVFAGITNMLYGFIANVIEASDGRNYTMEEFWKAQAMVLNTVGGVNKLSPTGKKIRNIMRNFILLIFIVISVQISAQNRVQISYIDYIKRVTDNNLELAAEKLNLNIADAKIEI